MCRRCSPKNQGGWEEKPWELKPRRASERTQRPPALKRQGGSQEHRGFCSRRSSQSIKRLLLIKDIEASQVKESSIFYVWEDARVWLTAIIPLTCTSISGANILCFSPRVSSGCIFQGWPMAWWQASCFWAPSELTVGSNVMASWRQHPFFADMAGTWTGRGGHRRTENPWQESLLQELQRTWWFCLGF